MPTKTVRVRPERFMRYRGVSVFHAYDDDSVEAGVCDYRFTLDPESDDHAFDIRSLGARGLVDISPLSSHPPFLTDSCEPYRTASEAQRAEWRAQWDEWHAYGKPHAIKRILRQLIASNVLRADRPEGPDAPDGADAPIYSQFAGPTIQAGQRWRKVGARINREVTVVGHDATGKVIIEFEGRRSTAKPQRFDGRRGGFVLVSDGA